MYIGKLQKIAPNLKGQAIVVYEKNGVRTLYKDNENNNDNNDDNNNNNNDVVFDEGAESEGEMTDDDDDDDTDPTYSAGDEEDVSEDDSFPIGTGPRTQNFRSPLGAQTPAVSTPRPTRQKRQRSPTGVLATPAPSDAAVPQTALPSPALTGTMLPLRGAQQSCTTPLPAGMPDEVMSAGSELPPPPPPAPLELTPPTTAAQQAAVVEAAAEPTPVVLLPVPMDEEFVAILPAVPDQMPEAPAQLQPAALPPTPEDEEIEQLHMEFARKKAKTMADEKQALRVPVLEEQLAEASTKLNAAQQALQACQQERANELASHNAALQQQAAQLAAERAEHNKRVLELQQRLTTEHDEHRATVQQLQRQIDQLTEERGGYNATVQRLQQEKQALEQKLVRLKDEVWSFVRA